MVKYDEFCLEVVYQDMPYASLFCRNEETLSITSHIFITKITGQQKNIYADKKREQRERERERLGEREKEPQIHHAQDSQYR